MVEVKSALQSKTVWAGLGAVVVGLAGFMGIELVEGEINDLIMSGGAFLAGLGAIWGRINAKHAIR